MREGSVEFDGEEAELHAPASEESLEAYTRDTMKMRISPATRRTYNDALTRMILWYYDHPTKVPGLLKEWFEVVLDKASIEVRWRKTF